MVKTINSMPRIIVIGGGATGCGVARDLVLRGYKTILVESGNLGSGTSSRSHGMLQSGARYAVTDTSFAAECYRERNIISKIFPKAVNLIGGLFIRLSNDPEEYVEKFNSIKSYIEKGDCYQINFAQRFSLEYDGDTWEIFKKILMKYKAPYSSYMNFPFVKILSYSPERFLQIKNNIVETKPIKGTRPIHLDNEKNLLRRKKDFAVGDLGFLKKKLAALEAAYAKNLKENNINGRNVQVAGEQNMINLAKTAQEQELEHLFYQIEEGELQDPRNASTIRSNLRYKQTRD